MSFERMESDLQISRLMRQATALRYVAKNLQKYRDELDSAWSAPEISCFNGAINALIDRCIELESKTTALRGDIARAVDDILQEESKPVEQSERLGAYDG